MKTHKVAVIGCGALAQSVHLPNVQNNPRMDLVCTCDINGTVAEECAERFQARRVETDWRKVVETKDEVTGICPVRSSCCNRTRGLAYS